MLVTVDLGFSSFLFAFLIFVVLPVIGFFIHYKWRRAAERAEEIKRLLILTAEESARAEREAAASYQYVTSNSYQYQNGNVLASSQFVPQNSYQNGAISASSQFVESNSYQNGAVLVAKSNQCVVCFSPTTTRCARCKTVHYCSGKCQIAHWRQGHKDDCHPPTTVHHTDDLVSDIGKKVAKPDRRGINVEKSQSEITEITKSSEKHPSPDIKQSPKTSCVEIDNARLESPAEENIVDSNSELSCNSFSGFSASTGANGSSSSSSSSDDSSVCDSVISNEHERFEGHIYADHTFDVSDSTSNGHSIGATIPLSPKFASLVDSARPGFGREEIKLASNGSSGLTTRKGGTEPSKVSSGFWNGALDSNGIKGDSFSGPLSSYSNESIKKSGGETMPNVGSGSSKNEGFDFTRHADSSSIHNLRTVGSKVSNHVVINPGSSLRSAEISSLPRTSTETKLVSRAEEEEHLHYPSKCMNNGTRSGTANSSTVANCSPNSKDGLKTSVMKVVDQFRGSNMSKHFPVAVGSDAAVKYSDKGLFPYDLFVKLYNWNRVEFQPFGLANCGNSCYANAVLQCLVFTPPLSAYLLQGLHSKSCANKNWCFICEFESLILKSIDTKSPLSPIGILSQLQTIGSQLSNGREEDAHEFLRHVVETMQSVCLMECGANASDSLKEQTNLVGLTFGGYLRSKIKCTKCGGKSERQERMMDLTVEIEGEISSLEEALKQFTSTETLDGENKYHCVRCKSYEKAKKKMAVSEAPNVLTIALKRFRSGKYGKLNKPIRFPEILDLAPFMSGASDLAIYRLYGVVVHLDTMNAAYSGHYVCYVKNFMNSWFKVDDSVVTPVELETVLTKGAYMLLYARCSPRAPRLIRDLIVSSDSKIKLHGKSVIMKYKHASSHGSAECTTNLISPYDLPALETINSKFHRIKSIMEEDSSSDNSSLISNNSDECSCSTDSTCDSTGTDEFADYIFGNSGRGGGGTSTTCSRVGIDGLLYRSRPVEGGKSEGCVPHLHHNTNIEHRNRKLDTCRSSFRENDSLERAGSNNFSYINSGVTYRKARERKD